MSGTSIQAAGQSPKPLGTPPLAGVVCRGEAGYSLASGNPIARATPSAHSSFSASVIER